MEPRIILNSQHVQLTINRLCCELIENHNDFQNTVLIGLQPNGIYLANRIHKLLQQMLGNAHVDYGHLDITFFRDDFRRRDTPLKPSKTSIDFLVEDKNVILIDDVLFTGRTIRAGLDAMTAYGRPRSVELLVLIDRRFSRHLPIQPDYTGKTVDSIASERVEVCLEEADKEDKVILFTRKGQDE